MHVMFVGSVGAGKTFNAVAFAAKSFGPNVWANMDLEIPGRTLRRWTNFSEIAEANCGTLFIDEADMWLNSRDFAKLDSTARDVIKEHRKHHLRIVTTTQNVTFVDKIFRILCDEVRVVKKVSVPLLGFLWPDCVRPSITCRHCQIVRQDDGEGDQEKWWRKWTGFGTFYIWRVYPPDILGEQETANADVLLEKNINATGWGWQLYSQRIAAMYDTSAKASVDARAMRAHSLRGSAPGPFSRTR